MENLSIYKGLIKTSLCLFISLLFLGTPGSAQSLSVESFRLLENDLAANTQGTMMYDQNGEIAALIRVVTSEKGFVFDGGMMGIVGTRQDVGEILLYVPHSIQKITIKHDQLGVLRDYYFPVPIERARTYELKLKTGTVRTIVEQTFEAQYVVFKVNPTNAVIFIDNDEPRLLDSDGMLSIRLKYGQHTYRATAASYISESGTIDVQSEKITKDIVLKSTKPSLTVSSAADAEIWINDVRRGLGSWTGDLDAGVYLLEARKASHISVKQEITLNPQDHKSVTLADPIPIYGSLDIQSSPLESNVYIDGMLVGQTPLIIEKFLTGEHKIRIQKNGYYPIEQTITIDEGSQFSQKYNLQVQQNGSELENYIIRPGSDSYEFSGEQFVDLGLSVKWATCNIGANSPEEFGNYYSWGEVEYKDSYTWSTYKYSGDSSNKLTKYCSKRKEGYNGFTDENKTLLPEDDVAHVLLGEKWRIPTKAEQDELLEKCTWKWVSYNGVYGYKVISNEPGFTDSYIFLPAAGYFDESGLVNVGNYGSYWSNSLSSGESTNSWHIYIDSDNFDCFSSERHCGFSIRPVYQ